MSEPVIAVEEVAPGIVQITMQDRSCRNAFSREVMVGLTDAFASLSSRSTCRAAVLTGYDTYFSSGGTQEQLLELQQSRGRLGESPVYNPRGVGALSMVDGILSCEVPVIAAMQGHGIGGGLVLGLYCDFAVFSRESIFTTNFMRYGFTPGLGATCIVPRKLGTALGTEMLLGARNYRGVELADRGIPYPVLPRAQVLSYALDLARDLAEKPRASLSLLKRHLTAPLREELSRVVAQEFEMHDRTLHEADVRDRIASLYGR